MKVFSSQYPATLLLYYICIHIILAVTMHPSIVIVGFAGACAYLSMVYSFRFVLQEVRFYSLVILLITAMYASFAHNGATPLFFYNDHAITMEAISRGAFIGVLVTTIAFWLKAYTATMQTNHFLFLFTKVHPKLGLFTSMCFRFYPYYRELWRQYKMNHRGVLYFQTDSRFERIYRMMSLYIYTITQVIDTVFWKPSTMQAKGFQRQRTQFELFRWSWMDTFLTIICLSMTCFTIAGAQRLQYDFYPVMQGEELSLPILLALVGFYFLPAIIEGKELVKWHYLHSKM